MKTPREMLEAEHEIPSGNGVCEHGRQCGKCEPCDCDALEAAAQRVIKRLLKERDEALAVLGFYADPNTYYAVTFFVDPPYGELADDISDCGLAGRKPGKRARIALGLEEKP